MTVYTLPARPGRQGPDAGAQPRPVPWQQMLWVTWRQHRGPLISVGVVFVVLVAAMLALGTRIHQDYGTLMSCRPVASGNCQGLLNSFHGKIWKLVLFVRIAVQALPVLLALFVGPPVLARELENSTFRYAWTQGIGRERWTLLKFAILGTVVVVAALVTGELFAWFVGPYQSTQLTIVYHWGSDATPTNWSVFNITGIVYAAWLLTALCLGVFLGMLVRRTLLAMAITVGGWSALALLTAFFLRPHYPVTTYWPMQVFETAWLLALSAALIAGTVRLVRYRAS